MKFAFFIFVAFQVTKNKKQMATTNQAVCGMHMSPDWFLAIAFARTKHKKCNINYNLHFFEVKSNKKKRKPTTSKLCVA